MRSLGIRDSPGRRRSPAFSKARARTCPLTRTLTSHPLAPSRGKGPGAGKRRAEERRVEPSPPTSGLQDTPALPNPSPARRSLSARAHSALPGRRLLNAAHAGPEEPNTHLDPWRRRWLRRGSPLPRQAARAAQASRHNGRSRGAGQWAAPRPPPAVSARALRGPRHMYAAPRARAVPPKRPRYRGRQAHSSPYRPEASN